MNQSLAALIISRIENAGLLWTDKVAGLTRPITSKHPGTKHPRTWPISCGVLDPLACDEGTILDLMPDEKYRSILFIEGETFPRREQDRVLGIKYVSDLRIVVWLNCAKVATGCGCGDHASRDLIRAIEGRKYATGPFKEIKHTVVGGGPSRGTSIFGKYTFDEARSQYLHYPFDFFALDVRTEFRLLPGCEENLDPSSTECWTPPPGPPRKWPDQLTCEELTDPVHGLTEEQLGPDCLDCSGEGPCPTECEVIAPMDPEDVVDCVTDGNIPSLLAATMIRPQSTPEVIVVAMDAANKTDGVRTLICTPCPECDPFTATLNGVEIINEADPCGASVALTCDDLVDAVVVEDAGDAAVNGLYLPDGTHNGQTRYTIVEGTNGADSIEWDGDETEGRWVILSGSSVMYRCTLIAPTDPWDVTYGDAGGGEPAPTVLQATIADLCPCEAPECEDVTILDQNDAQIASVPSGGDYHVLVFSGIDGGNATTVYSNSIVQP